MRAYTSTRQASGLRRFPVVAAAPRIAQRAARRNSNSSGAAAAARAALGEGVASTTNAAAAAAAATATSPLEPYIVVDRCDVLRASWDAREHCESECARLRERLEAVGAESVELGLTPALPSGGGDGISGGGSATSSGGAVTLTVTCAADGGARDALAAVILEGTPALEVRYRAESRAALPVRALAVATPYGAARVRVSLKGSEPYKASPDWPSCERAAAAAAAAAATGAGGPAPTATDVAEAALEELRRGLENGSIVLSTPYHF